MISLKGLKGIDTRYYIMAFLLFSVVPAFYVWHSVWYSFFIVILSVMLMVNISNHGYESKSIGVTLLFFLVFLIYIYRAGLNIYGAVEIICLLPLFLIKKESMNKLFDAFLKVYAIAMGIGIPLYILTVWIGVSLPHAEIQPFNDAKILPYYSFSLFVTEEGVFTPFNPRFFGMFDEPGVVGTISAILLISERFNLRKWENIIVLISGVLSASLFFFLICGVYVLLESPMKAKIAVIVVALIAVFVLYDNELLYNIFFRRFNVEDGSLEGMNREHGDFATFYERFRHTPEYWTGLGADAGVKANMGGSSYKQLIVSYGLIFFVVYIASYYLFALTRLRGGKKLFVYSLVLLGTMYQRPFVGTPTMTFLMIASIYAIQNNFSSTKTKPSNSDVKSVSISNSNII